jgi:hypothetical protein
LPAALVLYLLRMTVSIRPLPRDERLRLERAAFDRNQDSETG